jgi:hypothetical protein
VRTLLVFIAVAALSVLASSPRLRQAGRFFFLAQLSASGLLFLVLGAITGPGGLRLLPENDLVLSRPLLALGLGFAGLLIGLHLDPGLLRQLPARVYAGASAHAGLAFLAVAAPMGLLFLLTTSLPLSSAVGAAALLGGVASVSSGHYAVIWFRAGRLERAQGLSIALLTMLDDLVGLSVLALALAVAAHPSVLVGMGLVGLAALLGIACGALIAYLVHETTDPTELTAILLGAVALVSGAAAFLKISALIAGVSCGATLAVIGGRQVVKIHRALGRTERPVYLLLLFLAGAHAVLVDARAWLLLPAFIALRFLGKIYGGRLARRTSTPELTLPPELGYALIGQGGLSVCLLIEYLVLVGTPIAHLVFDIGVLAAVVNEVIGARTFRLSLGQPAPARALR